jgi:hypothetical protein
MPCHAPVADPCGKIRACCMPPCKACCMPRCISSLRRLCCLLGTTAEPVIQSTTYGTGPTLYRLANRTEGCGAGSLHRTADAAVDWRRRKARQERTALSTATMLRGNAVYDSEPTCGEQQCGNIYIRLQCNILAPVRILSANGASSGVLRITHSSDGPCRRRRRAFRAPAPKTDCRSPRMSGRT